MGWQAKYRPRCRRIAAAAVIFAVISSGNISAARTGDGYILSDSWETYLNYGDIEDMPLQVVCYAKNEIYARKGRTFYSEELQNYFSQQSWYVPVYQPEQFSSDMLNAYESANALLLSEREDELGPYVPDGPGYSYGPVYDYISVHTSGYDGYDVDPDSSILPDSSVCYLSENELQDLNIQELCYAKNEIYARHGRKFRSRELTSYFNQKSWYSGTVEPDDFSADILNEYESANAGLLDTLEHQKDPGGYRLDEPGYSYATIGSYVFTAGEAEAFSEPPDRQSVPAPDEYIFRDSSTRFLTQQEVSGLSLQQLCYARNEIYARRGYIFQSQELRDYFGSKSWYQPEIQSSAFSSSIFNVYEVANIDLLKQYEYTLNVNGYQLY